MSKSKPKGRTVAVRDPAAKAMLAARKDHRHKDERKEAKRKAARGRFSTDEAAHAGEKPAAAVPQGLTPSQALGWILSESVHGYCVERDDDLDILPDDDAARTAARSMGFRLDDAGQIIGWKCPKCDSEELLVTEMIPQTHTIFFGQGAGGGAFAGGHRMHWDCGDGEKLECSRCAWAAPVPCGLITEYD